MYLAETATRPAVETAIQKYVPESSSLTFIISRDLPVITTRSLLGSKVIPSRDHVILGGGAPVAWHCNCRVIPAVMMMSPGPEMLATGRAGGREGGERKEGGKGGREGRERREGQKGGREGGREGRERREREKRRKERRRQSCSACPRKKPYKVHTTELHEL